MKSKYKYLLITILTACAIALQSGCSDGHKHGSHDGHDHSSHDGHENCNHDSDGPKKTAGPNGGRLIESVEPHLEFLLAKDRKIQVTFIDNHGHTVAPGNQEIKLIGGDRSDPTKLSFSKQGNKLTSNNSLPDGNNLPIVLQIKTSPDSKTITERFVLNTSDCPTCDYKEYACVCSHH